MTRNAKFIIKIEVPSETEKKLVKNPTLSLNILPIIQAVSSIQEKINTCNVVKKI